MSTKNTTRNLKNLLKKFEGYGEYLRNVVKDSKEKLSDLTEANYNLGLYHLKANNLRDATFRFKLVLYFNPSHKSALFNLAKCLIAQNKKAQALEKLELALKIYPEFSEAKYLMATLDKSKTIDNIPLSIIKEYYDSIASEYNIKYSPQKGYKLPEYMSELFDIHVKALSKKLDILDIGCGTGRCSKAILRKHECNTLVGVDISNKMLEEAQKLTHSDSNIFDDLINVDFKNFLKRTSSTFDLIIAGEK